MGDVDSSPNDELAPYAKPTPEQTATADRLIAGTRMTATEAGLWDDDRAFLPITPEQAARQQQELTTSRALTAQQLQRALDDMLRWPPPYTPIFMPPTGPA